MNTIWSLCGSMLPVFLWKFGERTVVLTVAEELKESLPVMSELKKWRAPK